MKKNSRQMLTPEEFSHFRELTERMNELIAPYVYIYMEANDVEYAESLQQYMARLSQNETKEQLDGDLDTLKKASQQMTDLSQEFLRYVADVRKNHGLTDLDTLDVKPLLSAVPNRTDFKREVDVFENAFHETKKTVRDLIDIVKGIRAQKQDYDLSHMDPELLKKYAGERASTELITNNIEEVAAMQNTADGTVTIGEGENLIESLEENKSELIELADYVKLHPEVDVNAFVHEGAEMAEEEYYAQMARDYTEEMEAIEDVTTAIDDLQVIAEKQAETEIYTTIHDETPIPENAPVEAQKNAVDSALNFDCCEYEEDEDIKAFNRAELFLDVEDPHKRALLQIREAKKLLDGADRGDARLHLSDMEEKRDLTRLSRSLKREYEKLMKDNVVKLQHTGIKILGIHFGQKKIEIDPGEKYGQSVEQWIERALKDPHGEIAQNRAMQKYLARRADIKEEYDEYRDFIRTCGRDDREQAQKLIAEAAKSMAIDRQNTHRFWYNPDRPTNKLLNMLVEQQFQTGTPEELYRYQCAAPYAREVLRTCIDVSAAEQSGTESPEAIKALRNKLEQTISACSRNRLCRELVLKTIDDLGLDKSLSDDVKSRINAMQTRNDRQSEEKENEPER